MTDRPRAVETLSETAPPVLLTSHDVLRGQKSVAITHNGALYRLQTTRQGKLILTK
ncbi:MAG: hemin uptake protein HemP [Thiobacillus sp.]|nr:hemin uptake protein HemP [Thiobacillus sp.]